MVLLFFVSKSLYFIEAVNYCAAPECVNMWNIRSSYIGETKCVAYLHNNGANGEGWHEQNKIVLNRSASSICPLTTSEQIIENGSYHTPTSIAESSICYPKPCRSVWGIVQVRILGTRKQVEARSKKWQIAEVLRSRITNVFMLQISWTDSANAKAVTGYLIFERRESKRFAPIYVFLCKHYVQYSWSLLCF